MASWESESSFKDDQNDSLPHSSATLYRKEAAILADEQSKVADVIRWPRMPELEEFEAMAEHIIRGSYYGTGRLLDTSAGQRSQLKMPAGEKPVWARLLGWALLDYKSPPAEAGRKKVAACNEIDIFATIQADAAMSGIREALRP